MPSDAFYVFNKYTVKEIKNLAKIFSEHNDKLGPNTAYGLLHGGLVILVSGWETYCEDVSKEAVKILRGAKDLTFGDLPKSIRREILKYAYQENFHNQDPLDTSVGQLPDEGWKGVLCKMVEEYLQNFNTPKFNKNKDKDKAKTKDLKKLFSLFLSKDVEKSIQELTGINKHSDEIDDLIRIRGDIAHRGEPNKKDKFNEKDLRIYLATFHKACAAIDAIIWQEFRSYHSVKTPWQLTDTIKRHLPHIEQYITQDQKDEKNAD